MWGRDGGEGRLLSREPIPLLPRAVAQWLLPMPPTLAIGLRQPSVLPARIKWEKTAEVLHKALW